MDKDAAEWPQYINSTNVKETKMFAFWKYDTFPFCLGGTIIKTLDSGAVSTKEFGGGSYFKPIAVLPDEAGVKIKQELEALEAEYNKECKALLVKYKRKAKKIANFL